MRASATSRPDHDDATDRDGGCERVHGEPAVRHAQQDLDVDGADQRAEHASMRQVDDRGVDETRGEGDTGDDHPRT